MPTGNDRQFASDCVADNLVKAVFPRLRDELLNLDKYMDMPPEAAHVKPASAWTDEVLDRFLNGSKYLGVPLPWPQLSGLYGVRPSEVTLWAGPGGTGKSLLTTQLAIRLAEANEKICIASLEMPPAITAYRLVRQALGGEMAFEDRVRDILQEAGQRIWLYEQTGIVHWRRMLALARYCHQELGITQFFIDSLMKCGIAKDDYNSQIAFVDALCALAKDTGMHIHLISHTRKGDTTARAEENQDVRGASEITDLADNVMILSRNRRKEREKEKRIPDEEILRESDAILTCGKDRHGEWQGVLKLWYHENSMTFLANAEALPRELRLAPVKSRDPGCDDDL